MIYLIKLISNYGQTTDIVYTLENPTNGDILAHYPIQIEEEEGSIELVPPSSSYFVLNGTVTLGVDESVILSSPTIDDILILASI
jgi:hypothetical protein